MLKNKQLNYLKKIFILNTAFCMATINTMDFAKNDKITPFIRINNTNFIKVSINYLCKETKKLPRYKKVDSVFLKFYFLTKAIVNFQCDSVQMYKNLLSYLQETSSVFLKTFLAASQKEAAKKLEAMSSCQEINDMCFSPFSAITFMQEINKSPLRKPLIEFMIQRIGHFEKESHFFILLDNIKKSFIEKADASKTEAINNIMLCFLFKKTPSTFFDYFDEKDEEIKQTTLKRYQLAKGFFFKAMLKTLIYIKKDILEKKDIDLKEIFVLFVELMNKLAPTDIPYNKIYFKTEFDHEIKQYLESKNFQKIKNDIHSFLISTIENLEIKTEKNNSMEFSKLQILDLLSLLKNFDQLYFLLIKYIHGDQFIRKCIYVYDLNDNKTPDLLIKTFNFINKKNTIKKDGLEIFLSGAKNILFSDPSDALNKEVESNKSEIYNIFDRFMERMTNLSYIKNKILLEKTIRYYIYNFFLIIKKKDPLFFNELIHYLKDDNKAKEILAKPASSEESPSLFKKMFSFL